MADVKAAEATPLDDVMLAMDVVDTLRHRQDLVTRELSETSREQQLIDKLRDIYHQQGIDVPDRVLKEGVEALAASRFVYTPPKPGFGTFLAGLYVTRGVWGRWAGALAIALVIVVGGYFGVYRPWVGSQAEQARIELAEGLPAEMDRLYQAIFSETKVQQAVVEAEEIRQRGKTAAAEGDRPAAEAAIAGLTRIRDTLRQEYTLRIVNRQGVQSGFWTFPEINTAATNYYIVVEPVTADGDVLNLPILNEETNQIDTVPMWGLRVSKSIYDSVEADKRDDGIIQRGVVGAKQYGFLDIDYVVPVLGGAVTKW
jgi:hypothetical protein